MTSTFNRDATMNAVAEILPPESGIAVYSQFRNELARFKTENEKVHFDYEDPKGNKEARSHIYKLRQSKAAVDKARQAEKAASLEYGRKVDAEAKEIISEIEEMIAVHQRPLDEIDERERQRVDRVNATFSAIQAVLVVEFGASSRDIAAAIDRVSSIVIGDEFRERLAEATLCKEKAISTLGSHLDAARKSEEAEAELARMRKEAAEREERAFQEQLRREAEENAAKARAEQEAREKKEAADALERAALAEREAADRAERDRKAAAELAERRAEEAVQAERERARREAEAATAAAAKREGDKKHQARIHGEIIAAVKAQGWGLTDDQIKSWIVAIRHGEIPHVSIAY